MLRAPALVLAAWIAAASGPAGAASPGDDATAKALVDSVVALNSTGEHAAAAKRAARILRETPLSEPVVADLLRHKGSAELRESELVAPSNRSRWLEAAIASFSSALEFAPDDVWSLWQRCWAYTDVGNLLTARRDCARARAIVARAGGPLQDDVSVALAEARLWRALGRPDLAEEFLLPFAEREGVANRWYLYQQIGLARHDRRDIDGALAAFDRAARLSADLMLPPVYGASIASVSGDALFAAGAFDAASARFADAARLVPDNPMHLYARCAADLRGGQTDAAVTTCADAAAALPRNAAALDAYGLALLEADRPDAALAVLDKARRLAPDNPFVADHLRRAREAVD